MQHLKYGNSFSRRQGTFISHTADNSHQWPTLTADTNHFSSLSKATQGSQITVNKVGKCVENRRLEPK